MQELGDALVAGDDDAALELGRELTGLERKKVARLSEPPAAKGEKQEDF